jgi:hypothetical protein
MERVMDTRRVARKKVAALLKRFSEHLTSSLATGTADLWHKVEHRLAQKPPASAPGSGAQPGVLRTPMQPQPMQQQQAKTKAEDSQ